MKLGDGRMGKRASAYSSVVSRYGGHSTFLCPLTQFPRTAPWVPSALVTPTVRLGKLRGKKIRPLNPSHAASNLQSRGSGPACFGVCAHSCGVNTADIQSCRHQLTGLPGGSTHTSHTSQFQPSTAASGKTSAGRGGTGGVWGDEVRGQGRSWKEVLGGA